MGEGFVCCYSDILFTSDVVRRVLRHPADIVLSVDTRWLERYQHRTQHPPDDAEKVTVQNGLRHARPSRHPPPEAHGEYTGMAKFTAAGAAQTARAFHRARAESSRASRFARRRSFEKAYLIHLYPGHDRSRREHGPRRHARRTTWKWTRRRILNWRANIGMAK